jgi:ATP-binding protein involved in chromosome partitioning
MITPLEIQRRPSGLFLRWSDQSSGEIPAHTLRQGCPCAECREMRGDTSHQKPLAAKKSLLRVIEHTRDEELRIEKIWAVGNYALGIAWGDGHNSGIYRYELLRELGGVP